MINRMIINIIISGPRTVRTPSRHPGPCGARRGRRLQDNKIIITTVVTIMSIVISISNVITISMMMHTMISSSMIARSSIIIVSSSSSSSRSSVRHGEAAASGFGRFASLPMIITNENTGK